MNIYNNSSVDDVFVDMNRICNRYHIAYKKELTPKFLNEFVENINWEAVSFTSISEDFISYFPDKVNWKNISGRNMQLSERFMEEFQDKLNWTSISKKQTLSEDFIRKFADKVNWNYISTQQRLSENFIREFADKVNWLNISKTQKISEAFIEEFKDRVHWDKISRKRLSESFIEKYQDKLDWVTISRCQTLSEAFIEKYQHKVCWKDIAHHQALSPEFIEKFSKQFEDYKIPKGNILKVVKLQKMHPNTIGNIVDICKQYNITFDPSLSDKFIEEFKNGIDWGRISTIEKLSEEFIKEFKDKINWYCISSNQKLSEEFIREFQDKVDWFCVSTYQKLSENFIREFQNKVNWLCISYHQTLSPEFIEEFKDKLNIKAFQNKNYVEVKKTIAGIDWGKGDSKTVVQEVVKENIMKPEDIDLNKLFKVHPEDSGCLYLNTPDKKYTIHCWYTNHFKSDVCETYFFPYDKNIAKQVGSGASIETNPTWELKEIFGKYKYNSNDFLLKTNDLKQIVFSLLYEQNKEEIEQPKHKFHANTIDDIERICKKYNTKFDKTLSDKFIEDFKSKSYWNSILQNNVSEDFIRDFQDKINWWNISGKQNLSEDLIREFEDKVIWQQISSKQMLSENFIREFQDKVDWACISYYQNLSEDFIREFKDKVDWYSISHRQKLSENFIREFQNKVVWKWVSSYQKLSEKFIEEFQDKLNVKVIQKTNAYKSVEQKEVIETKQEEKKMEKPNFWVMTKSDGEKAAYRVAGKQITKGTKAALIMLLSKQMKGDYTAAASELLDTQAGEALISMLLGYGLTYAPLEDNRLQRLAEEFRVEGMAVAGNAIIGALIENLLPVITESMKVLPPLEEATKLRVANNQLQEQDVEIETTEKQAAVL